MLAAQVPARAAVEAAQSLTGKAVRLTYLHIFLLTFAEYMFYYCGSIFVSFLFNFSFVIFQNQIITHTHQWLHFIQNKTKKC